MQWSLHLDGLAGAFLQAARSLSAGFLSSAVKKELRWSSVSQFLWE